MSRFSYLFIYTILLYLLTSCNLQKKKQFDLKKGDLLFQNLDADSISSAIETVTGGEKKLNFSHIGIVDINAKGDAFVLEAISKGVSYTPIDSFLNRNLDKEGNPKVVVGRLKSEFQDRIDQALIYGERLIGLPYDDIYIIGDSNYYCSELVYEIFMHSGDSSEIFYLKPMTFKDPDTGEFLPFWLQYYKDLGVEIPEGKPGLNPNGMFQSSNIDIVFSYQK